jgi:hypothetical protein
MLGVYKKAEASAEEIIDMIRTGQSKQAEA